MNNLELAVSAFTILATGTALFTSIKTLIDARNKSIKEFMQERELRHKNHLKKDIK